MPSRQTCLPEFGRFRKIEEILNYVQTNLHKVEKGKRKTRAQYVTVIGGPTPRVTT